MLSLSLALQFVGALDLGTASADLGIGGRLGPLARRISLGLAGGNGELDERAKTAEEPLLDEFSEDDAEFTGRRVNLLAQLASQGKNDLLELEEDDLDALQVDDVLGDDLLAPLNGKVLGLTLQTLPFDLLFEFGLFSGNLLVDDRLLGILGQLSDLCLLLLDLLDFGLASGHALFPFLELAVDGKEKRVLSHVDVELILGELVLEARGGRVVTLNDGHDIFSVDMGIRAVNQLGLLEQDEQVGDLERDVLAQAVRSMLPLREILENGAQLMIVLIEDRLTNFEVFL